MHFPIIESIPNVPIAAPPNEDKNIDLHPSPARQMATHEIVLLYLTVQTFVLTGDN